MREETGVYGGNTGVRQSIAGRSQCGWAAFPRSLGLVSGLLVSSVPGPAWEDRGCVCAGHRQ